MYEDWFEDIKLDKKLACEEESILTRDTKERFIIMQYQPNVCNKLRE